jgi:hypothetical protein
VIALQEALVEVAGFEPGDIVTLLDEQATRASIEEAFDRLVGESRADDVALFYFAGHGSRVPDANGDELDGHDETLVPYDAEGIDGEPNDLIDDCLRDMIARANERTRHVVLVFDCCNSGTNVRASDAAVHRFVDPQARGLLGTRRKAVNAPGDGSGYLDGQGSYVALSACRAHEAAYEYRVPFSAPEEKPTVHGLFTYCFLRELRGGAHAFSYDDMLARVRASVRRLREGQTPVIEGPLAEVGVFARTSRMPAASFRIAGSAAQPKLLAGRTSGLGPGAMLVVQMPESVAGSPMDSSGDSSGDSNGDSKGDPQGDPQGEQPGRWTIRLEQVGATMASFTWVDPPEPPQDLDPLLRARLVDPGSSEFQLPCAVVAPDESAAAKLRAAIQAAGQAAGVLSLAPPSEAMILLELSGGSWRAIAVTGEELPFRASADREDEVEQLVLALARIGRARAIESSVLREGVSPLVVETAMERVGGDGRRLGPLQVDAGGLPVLRPGDRIGCMLQNHSSVAVYASLLVISPDGEVSLAKRPQNEDDSIPPGGIVRAPVLAVVVHEASRGFYSRGLECFRWVVTTGFHDLRPLEQPSSTEGTLRGARIDSAPSAVEELGMDEWATSTMEIRYAVD